MPSKVAQSMSKDKVRDHIVRHLYEIHENSRGLSGIAIGIKDLKKAMKEHGINGREVNSNLDYLVQVGWVKEVSSSKTFKTPGGMVMESATKYFKISAEGIDLFEEASAYRRDERLSGINVTNIQGVTVIGDGNVVNTQYADLSRALSKLEEAVLGCAELDDSLRLDILSDIATIQTQIQKQHPDPGIISRAWSAIAKVADVSQLAELVAKTAPLVMAVASTA